VALSGDVVEKAKLIVVINVNGDAGKEVRE
jgi:hypothetical protein